jgi:hypothetical protein
VTGEWRKQHNEEFNYLYSSARTIWLTNSRRMRWPGPVGSVEERRVAYTALVRKPWGKIPLGRPRCRWNNIIKMNL